MGMVREWGGEKGPDYAPRQQLEAGADFLPIVMNLFKRTVTVWRLDYALSLAGELPHTGVTIDWLDYVILYNNYTRLPSSKATATGHNQRRKKRPEDAQKSQPPRLSHCDLTRALFFASISLLSHAQPDLTDWYFPYGGSNPLTRTIVPHSLEVRSKNIYYGK